MSSIGTSFKLAPVRISNERDLFAQGDCDSVFLDLIKEQAKKEKLPPRSVEFEVVGVENQFIK